MCSNGTNKTTNTTLLNILERKLYEDDFSYPTGVVLGQLESKLNHIQIIIPDFIKIMD